MTRCLMSQEVQIKPTMSYHFTSARAAVVTETMQRQLQVRVTRGSPFALLVRRCISPTLWKTTGRLLKKIKNRSIGSGNSTSGSVPKGNEKGVKRYLHPMFPTALFTIATIQKEAPMSIDGRMGKQGAVHTAVEEYSALRKEDYEWILSTLCVTSQIREKQIVCAIAA